MPTWTGREQTTLRRHFRASSDAEIAALLPRHNMRGIMTRAYLLGLSRGTGRKIEPKESSCPLVRMLTEARRHRGVSQQAVADAVGVDRVTIVKLERGHKDYGPRISVLKKWAAFFGLELTLMPRGASATVSEPTAEPLPRVLESA